MAYTVEQIVTYDNEDEWWPERHGRWVVKNAGNVVYTFPFRYKGDLAEWDERHSWQGPMNVRISDDGKFVECEYDVPRPSGELVERHPLP